MTTFAFPSPHPLGVSVSGSDVLFPVRRIYCVGRNYAEHAREMGGDPDREPPFFFQKPADAVVASGSTIPYPLATSELHHEIELVAAINKGGEQIPQTDALEHVYGYAAGIDLTRRDLQTAARTKGRPWDAAKGFDQSAPISAIHRAADIGHPKGGAIWLNVNGTPRQKSDLGQMVWPLRDIIRHLSALFRLEPGDLIFTGTPAGVGRVEPGDRLHGGIEGVAEITITVSKR